MKENRAKIWQAHIRQWEQSGLSQRRYCEERELSLSTFQWWRSRLKKRVNGASASIVRLPLAVSAAVQPSELVVEVGRYRVTIRGAADRDQLGRVLDALENR